jgi:hypothetical protein
LVTWLESFIVTAFHSSRSESQLVEVTAAAERCRREIAGIEALILAGHSDVRGLCQALADWSAELRIIEQEICANSKKPAAAETGRA